MASPAELPDLVREFTDMSRDYLLQETVEPARQLGRHAGYSFGAAVAFALGATLLAVAGMRWIIDALPEGVYWSALGYLISVVALGLIIYIVATFTARESRGS